MYKLKAHIKGDPCTIRKLYAWAKNEMPTDQALRCTHYNPYANTNWIGLIPAAINVFAYGSFRFCGQGACYDSRMLQTGRSMILWFRSSGVDSELWDFLLKTDSGIDSVRVDVLPDDPQDEKKLNKPLPYEKTRIKNPIDKEFEWMKEALRGQTVNGEQLRCLWTAYVLHQGFVIGSAEYERALKELQDAASECMDRTGCDVFKIFISKYLMSKYL